MDEKWRETNREKLAWVCVSFGKEKASTVTARSLQRNSEIRREGVKKTKKTTTPLSLSLCSISPSVLLSICPAVFL